MLSAKEMLEAGSARLTELFPVDITIEGVTGTVRGRMPRRSNTDDLIAGGFSPNWTGTLAVDKTDALAAAWTPATNQRVTVDGATWIVGEVVFRTTSYLLRLASPDQ